MYQPDAVILKKYADVLVKFALNSGKGVQAGEVVQVVVPDIAKPIMIHLQQAILESGGHPMLRMLPTGLDKPFYELANEDQLTFFPKDYLKARVDLIDHTINIIADHDLFDLKDTDPSKIMKAAESKKQVREWLTEKENKGDFTWTLALYGTEAMAQEASMSVEEYWQQIIKACFLDEKDPIKEWQKVFKEQERVKSALNKLNIEKVHVEAEGVDLWVRIGEKRQWLGGSGRNIPSFEIFTSPDWRGTEGFIEFNLPLYRYGNLVKGIRLEFKEGKVVNATAEQGEELLKQIIGRPDADKVGEFSLTDARLTKIDKFMANTLFDENTGDKNGNTHIAVGMAYKDALDGDPSKLSKEEWEKLGFNDSGEHTDIMSTTNRTVTAYTFDGKEKVIYKDGQFTV